MTGETRISVEEAGRRRGIVPYTVREWMKRG